MSGMKDRIYKRLKTPDEAVKKSILVPLKEGNIENLDFIAKTLTKKSGKATSRNILIEDAVEEYIKTAFQIFEESGIQTEEGEAEEVRFDTVVFPAYEEGFRETFLGEDKWYYVRVSEEKIPYIKYIAAYVGKPVSAITHYAKVKKNGFEYVEEEGKYVVHFSGSAIELPHSIPLGDSSPASTRAPRYTTLHKLLNAKKYGDLK